MKLADELFKKYQEREFSYPNEIVSVPKERLKGTAFFPGGDGIYKEISKIEKENYPILILGKDYDNECNFNIVKEQLNQSEIDNNNNTWLNLKKILGDDVLNNCYFSNCIMGLRKGNSKNTGSSVAFLNKNGNFLKENIEFFKEQLDIIKPKLIIGLGSQIPRFIGECFRDELPLLSNMFSFKQLDESKYNKLITLKNNDDDLTIIFITHPALYYANVWRRKGGFEFEKDLINDAIDLINKKH